MNTVLPIGEPLGLHYHEWRTLVSSTPDPPVGKWIRDAAPELTEAEMAACDAPYPDAVTTPAHELSPRHQALRSAGGWQAVARAALAVFGDIR